MARDKIAIMDKSLAGAKQMNGKGKKKKSVSTRAGDKGNVKKRKPAVKEVSEVDLDLPLEEDLEELEKGIFFAAEAAIDEAIRLNCDVSEAQLFLEKGRAQFKLGNFDYADNYCQLALNAAKDSSKRVRTESLFHEIARMIKDNAELYSNIENIESSYREAEKQFEGGNYDTAMDLLEEIKKNAIDVIFENIINETETKLQSLADKIRKYKKKNLDVDAPLDILGQANDAFDENDYLTANDLAEKALQILNSLLEPELKAQADDVIEKMNKLINSEILDKDALLEAEPFFEDLQNAFDSGDYEFITSRDRELSEIAERIIKIGKLTEHQMVQEKIKNLEENLRETELLGVDVTDVRDALDKSKKALSKKNFESAKDWLQKSHHLNDKIRDKYLEKKVESIIFSAQSLINEIADTGANVEDAENRLESAKKLLAEKNYDESRKIAEQTIIIARENLLGHLSKRAESMLIKNQKILKDLKSRKIDISNEEKLYKKAQAAYKENDYTTAMGSLKKIEESTMKLLNKDLSFQVIESLKQFEEKINEAREFDIPVDDFVRILEDVKLKLEAENFVEAERIISNSLGELNEKLKDLTLRKKLNEILSDIESIRNLGAGVKRLEALRERAAGALNKGNLVTAEDTINKLYVATKKNLTETYSLQVGKQLRNLENKVKGLKERGVEINEIDIIYNDAVEALRNRDYQTALNLLNKGDDMIDEFLEEDKTKNFESDLDKIIEKVNEYKVAGLDVEKLETAIKNIKERLDENDYPRAKDLIRQTEKGVLQLKESKKVNELLSDIEGEIKEVKDLGINVNKLEDAYGQAMSAAKRNDLRRAVDIGRDISSILTMIKKDRLKRQAKDLVEGIESDMKKAKDKNIAIENSDELLTLALDALKRNEFEDSIKYSRQVEEILKKEEKMKVTMNVQRKLEVFQFEVDQASNQGMDVRQYIKSIKDVKNLLEEGKPNPASDVLNFSQRSFKKTLKSMESEKPVVSADKFEGKTPVDQEVVASSSPLITDEMGEMPPAASPGKDADGAAMTTNDDDFNDPKKKFNSLGNVGMKTLEGMGAKANNMEDIDAAELEKELLGLVEDDMDLPFMTDANKAAAGTRGVVKDEKGGSGKEKAEVLALSEKEITEKFELSKKELIKLKSLEKRGFKAKIPQLESLMNATELALGDNNLKTADKFVTEGAVLIANNLRPMRLQFSLTNLKSEVEDLWSAGEKLGKSESLLNQARKALEKQEFDEAEPHIEELEGIVTKLRNKRLAAKVKENLKEAQKMLNGLKKLDVEAEGLAVAESLFTESQSELSKNNVSAAMEKVKRVIENADSLERSYWEPLLESEQEKISEMVNSVPEGSRSGLEEQKKDLFERASQQRSTGTHKKAMKILTDGQKAIETEAKRLVNEAEAAELDIPDTKQMQKAKKAFEKITGRPVSKQKKVEAEVVPEPKPEAGSGAKLPFTLTITGPMDDSIDPVTYSRSLITDVVLLMQHVKDDDKNVDEANKLLQEAKEEYMYKNFENANDLAFSARDTLIKLKPELFSEQAAKDIEDLKYYFEDLRSIEVETEPLERNMKTINDDLQKKEFVKVLDACLKLKSKAKRLKLEFLKVTLRPKINDLVKELMSKKDKGADITEIQSYLADAEDSISDEDFDGASQLYNKALGLYTTMPSEEEQRKIEVRKTLESLKVLISENEGYKLDFSKVEALYPSVEEKLVKGDIEGAEAILGDARKKMDTILKQFAQKVQKRVELEIEDVALSGADPKEAKEQLNKAKKLIESKEFKEAISTLEAVERMAIETGDAFMKVFEGLRKLTRELASVPADSVNYEEIVKLRNEAKKSLEKKDYISALATINKANKLLSDSE